MIAFGSGIAASISSSVCSPTSTKSSTVPPPGFSTTTDLPASRARSAWATMSLLLEWTMIALMRSSWSTASTLRASMSYLSVK